MNRNLILLSSLLLLQIPTFPIKAASPSIAQDSTCKIERESEFYSTKELQTLANKITVKVIGDNNGGSGTLIGKQGNNYLVLTNSHVIQGVNSIKLQTPDNKTYSAEIVPQKNFKNSDITLLKFKSNQNYCLSEITKTTPDIDTPILASGFSVSTGKITFSGGEVKKTSNLKEGYEIGYNSNIEQGMSGGAILNSMGELVGINGKSSYPILNTGYVYQNGSRPSESEIREMRKLSWGIPISTVLARVDRDILTAYKLPEKASKVKPSQSHQATELSRKSEQKAQQSPKLTGWLGELEQKAKQFTVRIDSSSKENGSGIIIAKEGNTYTVLTAAHVVCEGKIYANQPCQDYKYEILAPDGKKYPVDKSSKKIEEGVDLAVVKFNSPQNYQIATLADYSANHGDFIFTAGYPKFNNNSPWRFTVGFIFNKERGLLAINQPDFQNNDSDVLQSTSSLTGGYELVYTSITYGGMSGGPVLDSQGRVIGIHGRSEGEEAGDFGKVQIGYSLGIPVSTFLGLVPRLGIKPHSLENTRPPQLNAQKQKLITQAILSTDVSGGNTTAAQWLERGNQLWRLERFNEAVKAFDEAIKQKPSFAYLAYYGKGLALISQKKNQEAVTALKQAVKLKPDFVAAWEELTVGYRNLKQLNKALFAINKAIQLQPKNPNLHNEKWFVLLALKQYAKAEAAITQAIKFNPRVGFYSNRGNLYSEQKKWDLALADYNKAIQINPKLAQTYINRGNLYLEQKKWNLALADYNKAIQINPNDAQAYYNRGLLYLEQKKWNLALADYNKAIQINPNYAEAYHNRAHLYKDQNKWDLALADYNKAIQINPNYAEAYYNRGLFYSEQKKKWDLALADYNKVIQINPDFAIAYNNRGLVYKEQKKWELALANYNKAIEINPNLAEPYYNRGLLYLEQKKIDLAQADFEKAIQINPNLLEPYNNQPAIYLVQKKRDLTLADLNKIIQINPDDANAYYNRGVIYSKQKKWNLALADFTKAIQINPDFANAYYNRGFIYSQQKKWDLALADLNKLIQINPDDANTYYNRVLIYSQQKKWDLVLADLNKIIQINPDDANTYYNRSVIYFQQKKWDLAVADFNKAIQINPNYADAYNNRGAIYLEQKKWNLALAEFSKAIQTNPNHANAYANRALILIKTGNKQKGIQDLQKAAQLFKAQGDTASYKQAMNQLQELQN